jgi:translation initiation factor IF-3
LRINREIRAARVRVIDSDGSQLGVLALSEALMKAEQAGLDLIEISASSDPPVCKIIDYGKYRYQLTKKEREGRKSQHQVKVKEVKVKPNTDDHDIQTKLKHAREFIEKGDKVKITCTFRGREMMRPEFGERVVRKLCEGLADIATPEAPGKLIGRSLSVTLAPGAKKKPMSTAQGT